ncbi:hypothetical protein EVAR_74284_1 [Eumeta japonica]|uniref:Uncharacterized protein n=1 Tax=Eumeta variegata TaxID=151549 RepID=A0A4C1SFG2_EUMVA|nr:hypothetical protein EVAR_74284_1 [Eumeta japonica]
MPVGPGRILILKSAPGPLRSPHFLARASEIFYALRLRNGIRTTSVPVALDWLFLIRQSVPTTERALGALTSSISPADCRPSGVVREGGPCRWPDIKGPALVTQKVSF